MTVLGVVFRPQNPPELLERAARAADEAGLAELWLWEDCFLESGIASASAALAWTRRVRICVGVLPVPLRNVALTAMEIATLERLFPGRVTVGVGHGVQSWMAQVGARPESPLTLLREQLTALRALLRGEEVTVEGRYVRLDGVALDWPPADPPRLFAGGTGPRTLSLTGEEADGTILTASTTPADLRAARARVDGGRASSAGTAGRHPVVVYLSAATGPGAAERLAAENGALPDAPGVAGDAAALAAEALRYAEAGADHVVFQPTPDEPDLEGFVRLVAEDVGPLVAAGT